MMALHVAVVGWHLLVYLENNVVCEYVVEETVKDGDGAKFDNINY